MSHRDLTADQDDTHHLAQAEQGVADQGKDLVQGQEDFALDLEAGPLLADFLSQSAPLPDGDGGDFHAAIAALRENLVEPLDPAVQHLTESIDLFDVQADDISDAG